MLILREDDVHQLLSMHEAIKALQAAFLAQDTGEATNTPRARVRVPEGDGVLHLLGAALETQTDHITGFKAYYSSRTGVRFMVVLFSTESGEMLCAIEANRLGQLRTGAASGLATRSMARADAATLGLYGTGFQAETQLEAVCTVRPIKKAMVYGPNAQKRAKFADTMSTRLNVEVVAVDRPEEAAQADIITTATTAKEPVLLGDWLPQGTHVNAVGANMLIKRELDDNAVRKMAAVVVDSREQALKEAFDIIAPLARGWLTWERVWELHEVVSGARTPRTSDSDITLFKSLGIGLEDIAVGALVYHHAVERGLGQRVAFLDL